MAQASTAGIGNTFKTPQVISAIALERLKSVLFLPRIANYNYQKDFLGKIGNSIVIKRPYYTSVTSGRVATEADRKRLIDQTTELRINNWHKWFIDLNSVDTTLNIVDLYDRYIKSGVEELAYRYEEDGFTALTTGIGGSVGTAGNAFTSQQVANGRAFSANTMIPQMDSDYLIINPTDLASLYADLIKPVGVQSDTNSATHLNAPQIATQMLNKSYQGNLFGYNVYVSANAPTMDVFDIQGGASTPLVANSGGYEGDTLPTDGWGIPVSGDTTKQVLNKGQMITIDGVYDRQPRGTRKNLGNLKSFAVKEDVFANSTGVASIKISPNINAGGLTDVDGEGTSVSLKDFQNVASKPADNATINVIGDEGKRYAQGFYYNKMSLAYVNVPLSPVLGAAWTGEYTDDETGITISFMGDPDILQRSSDIRLDIHYATGVVYPELSFRQILEAT